MEPVLRKNVSKGRILCAICFDSCSLKNIKRAKFHEVKDVEKFKKVAESWLIYDHDYSRVYDNHDWLVMKKLYIHNRCRDFLRDSYRIKQPLKTTNGDMEVDDNVNDHLSEVSDGTKSVKCVTSRKSRQTSETYITSRDNLSCIICNTTK